jgi:hypothetical protein
MPTLKAPRATAGLDILVTGFTMVRAGLSRGSKEEAAEAIVSRGDLHREVSVIDEAIKSVRTVMKTFLTCTARLMKLASGDEDQLPWKVIEMLMMSAPSPTARTTASMTCVLFQHDPGGSARASAPNRWSLSSCSRRSCRL